MRIAPEIVQESIQRAGRMRTKVADTAKTLAGDDRPRRAPPLQKGYT